MSFWLHDEMVSIDLLESLPQVDSDSLGVVGCSGGGTQSSYLGAMDPRTIYPQPVSPQPMLPK